jgi:hypothetical protein
VSLIGKENRGPRAEHLEGRGYVVHPEGWYPTHIIGIGLTLCLGKRGMLGPCSTDMPTIKFGPVLSQSRAVTMQCRFGKDLWRNVDRSVVLRNEFSRLMQRIFV